MLLMTNEALTKGPSPAATRRHVHLTVARRRGHTVTELGLGTVVHPQLLLVPMTMSGPLRPRLGVVVRLPGRDDLVPVNRILRSEESFGNALGLLLAAPVPGLAVEIVSGHALQDWLLDCRASGVGAYTGRLSDPADPTPPSPPTQDENDLPRGGTGGIVCRMFPAWRGCR